MYEENGNRAYWHLLKKYRKDPMVSALLDAEQKLLDSVYQKNLSADKDIEVRKIQAKIHSSLVSRISDLDRMKNMRSFILNTFLSATLLISIGFSYYNSNTTTQIKNEIYTLLDEDLELRFQKQMDKIETLLYEHIEEIVFRRKQQTDKNKE